MGDDFGRGYSRRMARAFSLSGDIVRMKKDGLTVPEIAQEVDLTPKLVRSVLRSADNGESTMSSHGWTNDQDETILRMRLRQGRLWTPIGEAVGKTADEAEARFNYLQSRKSKWKPKSLAKCMTCGDTFVQEFRFNRRCVACKTQESGLPDSFLVITDGDRESAGNDV